MSKYLICFLALFISGSLQALTVLPPATSAGSDIGRAFGDGLAQGMKQGADIALEHQFQQRKEEIKSQQELAKQLQFLQSQKEEVENEWIKDFINDVAKLNVVERINKISPITDINSFSGEHPAVQCVVAQLILYRNLYPELSELSKCLSPKKAGDSNFALELLSEAANKKKYIQAKKILATYYQDKKSYPQILYWLHSAAEDGASDAMRVLARHYGLGLGVPIDMAEMHKWMALAQAKGDKQANLVMDVMIKNKEISTSAEFLEGLKRAKDWKQQHVSLFIHP